MSKTKIITILLWVTAINLSAQTYSGGEGTQEDPCLISSKANKAISRRDKIWVENRMTFQQPESRQGRDMGENGNDILSLTGQLAAASC